MIRRFLADPRTHLKVVLVAVFMLALATFLGHLAVFSTQIFLIDPGQSNTANITQALRSYFEEIQKRWLVSNTILVAYAFFAGITVSVVEMVLAVFLIESRSWARKPLILLLVFRILNAIVLAAAAAGLSFLEHLQVDDVLFSLAVVYFLSRRTYINLLSGSKKAADFHQRQ